MNAKSEIRNLDAERILVRGVNWLGDAVLSTSALLRLRERFPAARITLLTHEKLEDLWFAATTQGAGVFHPAVNETITFSAGEGVFSVGRKLRAGNFDVALVFPNSPRSAMEAWLARIPQRIGYARTWRSAFLTRRIPPRSGAAKMHKRSAGEIRQLVSDDESRNQNSNGSAASNSATGFSRKAHQIHEYLHLVSALGANPEPLAPRLEVCGDEMVAALRKFNPGETRAGGQPIFGLNPGAEYGPAKRWPAERFAAAAYEIGKRTGCRWLIFGGKADLELATRVAAGIAEREAVNTPPVNLAGRTTLRELMALLKSCRVLLTNDTGPMHVAAALGTPVVVPFGSTSSELTGPGLPGDSRHRTLTANAPCAPCFRRTCPIDFRCMNGISVQQVVDAVLNCCGVL